MVVSMVNEDGSRVILSQKSTVMLSVIGEEDFLDPNDSSEDEDSADESMAREPLKPLETISRRLWLRSTLGAFRPIRREGRFISTLKMGRLVGNYPAQESFLMIGMITIRFRMMMMMMKKRVNPGPVLTVRIQKRYSCWDLSIIEDLIQPTPTNVLFSSLFAAGLYV